MVRKLTSGLTVAVIGVLAVWTSAAQAADDSEKAVVPVFSFKGSLVEKPVGDDLLLFGGGAGESLKDLIARMNQARDDDAVKGVVLLWSGASLGRGQTEEIRRAMDGIKAAGKDIHVDAAYLSTGPYTLLS